MRTISAPKRGALSRAFEDLAGGLIAIVRSPRVSLQYCLPKYVITIRAIIPENTLLSFLSQR
jgi:hypothetical protein